MAQSIFEFVLSDYFKNFQTNLKILMPENIPNWSFSKNYASGSRFKSSARFQLKLKKKSQYHILVQVDSEEKLNLFFPSFRVPCIFICFKYLVSPAKDIKINGELFDKLKLALTYSSQQLVSANLDLLEFNAIKKRLTKLLLSAASSSKIWKYSKLIPKTSCWWWTETSL